VDASDDAGRVVRPQTLLLALFGDQVLGRGVAVAAGSIIAVLNRLGVGEHATRATVARMARRDFLWPMRRGRQVFFGLAPRGVAVLRDGQRKLEAEIADREWDGRWTPCGGLPGRGGDVERPGEDRPGGVGPAGARHELPGFPRPLVGRCLR
jgi:phenylacetic acid degradation operon negative regulatory protein